MLQSKCQPAIDWLANNFFLARELSDFSMRSTFLLGLTKKYHLFLTDQILRPLIKDGVVHIEYHDTNLIYSLILNILLLLLLTTYLGRHQDTTLYGNYEIQVWVKENQTLKIYQGRCCSDWIDPNVLCQRSDCFFMPCCTKNKTS